MRQKYYILLGIVILLVGVLLVASLKESSTKKIYTPQEVWISRNSLLNEQITLDGISANFQLACTEMACSNSCCNSCGGGVGLRVDDNNILNIRGEPSEGNSYGTYNGKQVGCSGNECSVGCYPLESGKKYRVNGILKKDYDQFYLELKSFELI